MLTNEKIVLLNNPKKGMFGDTGEAEEVATVWGNVSQLGVGDRKLVEKGIVDMGGVILRLNGSSTPVHTDIMRGGTIYTLVEQTRYNELTVGFYKEVH
ncbi:hypothetical protein pwc_54 [Weissella phage PWc]|nr:hypothetical protein pwc_54 [Weissella phage PWc]